MLTNQLNLTKDDHQQAQMPGKPLVVIVSPSGDLTVTSGSTLELCVTVTNQGNQSALVDIYLDEVSHPLDEWCLAPRQRLALGLGQTSEVFFEVVIPVDAIPARYRYTLTVDAQQHYQEHTPIFLQGEIEVVPLISEARTVSDPTFNLIPQTTSIAPIPVEAGELLQATVIVHNRSDRVDQFRLDCPDLSPDWYSVIYPERYTESGMILVNDRLELNPGDQNQIQLLFKPPLGTKAGLYTPTIRLYSENNPELVLLEPFYLEILPVYSLNVELLTLVGRVKNQAGLFELRFQNLGNTPRELVLRVRNEDEEQPCTYTLKPSRIYLLPGESAIATLEIQPKHLWRRPFSGRVFNFVVEVEDTQKLPVLNDRLQGALLWEPRPWWQFLLLFLLILSAVAGTIFLVWWLLSRPPASPKIIAFSPQSSFYQEVNNEAIRLNFSISHPNKLEGIKLQGVSPDGLITTEAITYDLTKGIPESLANICTVNKVLNCQNVLTDARQPGDYVFELTTIPKPARRIRSESQKTSTIRIEPIPLPQVTELTSVQPVYEKVLSPGTDPANAAKKSNVLLNWKVTNPRQIQALKLVGRGEDGAAITPIISYDLSQGIPELLKPFCQIKSKNLVCQTIPIPVEQTGTYLFELVAIPRHNEEAALPAQKSDPIKVTAQPIPIEILEFKINNEPSLPKYIVVTNPDKPPVLKISWKVKGGENLKVEIMPAPGTVAAEGEIPYVLSPEATTETVMLKVTDGTGKEMTRSVAIQTVTSGTGTLTPGGQAATPVVPPPPPSDAAAQAPGTVPTLEDPTGKAGEGAAPGQPGDGSSGTAPLAPPVPPKQTVPLPAELPPQFY